MKISKNELKKISRKLRKVSSDVMNAHFREQNDFLVELINYVNSTPLIKKYIDSIEYDVGDLLEDVRRVNNSYGRQMIDLGSNSKKRTFLLYKTFNIIIEEKMPTYNFGSAYAGSTKYQDMAQSFGDRLVYPFVSDIGEYIKDIATDMGYDENNSLYNINVNSSGVQVNIADNNSSISAIQENNFISDEMKNKIQEIEEYISSISAPEVKENMLSNLEIIKAEIIKRNSDKNLLITSLKNMYLVAGSIAMLPDLVQGIKMLADMIGIAF